MNSPAFLILADGTQFVGRSIGADGVSVGEVVFNTAMTGYQEILTDPSYARQLVTLTYPHIGNTGVTPEDEESNMIHTGGLIIRDLPLLSSNFRAHESLDTYLKSAGVVAIADIDTRKLTRILRDKGAQAGIVTAGVGACSDAGVAKAQAALAEFPGLAGMDLAKEVTTASAYEWDEGSWVLGEGHPKKTDARFHVVAYDFGVKRNILRMLADRGCRLTVVPAKTPAEDVLAMNPDGVFLSNGPGDPEPCTYAIEAIKEILETKIPVFGICLGHQLLALASGAKTMKMKFGHHGANHPVQDIESGVVMITSQNHGFAIDEHTLPANLKMTHQSLFDQSLQGISRTDTSAFSFQGHPEASPGPHDSALLFDQFIANMEAR
ncbi:MAG: glutamine-hydrolyzing carbamoyl-phosphate synthase small subunit [Pseudomonadota bacterium]|nr:glutamine-hydrolyzing carbamoyl-phosphate synthase small subunit [Pseudomonadota bacterium]MEE2820750.1 glutamine-hydrolyzing carbamoyl-phosphate synthase small subunit [Pseudomonadota bacterium]